MDADAMAGAARRTGRSDEVPDTAREVKPLTFYGNQDAALAPDITGDFRPQRVPPDVPLEGKFATTNTVNFGPVPPEVVDSHERASEPIENTERPLGPGPGVRTMQAVTEMQEQTGTGPQLPPSTQAPQEGAGSEDSDTE